MAGILGIRLDGVGLDLIYSQHSALVQGTDEDKVVSQKSDADNTVVLTPDNGPIEGVVTHINDEGDCSVKTKGYVEVIYTGNAPARGFTELAGNGTGGVKVATTPGDGRKFWIKMVDTVTTIVGFFLE
jgi:hypothetical protein